MDYVRYWKARTEVSAKKIIQWLELSESKFYDWKKRYGKANQHNHWIPREWWLLDREKQAILDFQKQHPQQGYRQLTFMMLDADLVAVSASSVYRVLKEAGVLHRNWNKASKKGTGFEQPNQAHEHWHVDFSHVKIAGTFYFLCSVLDGWSRYLLHWEIREKMEESDVETILQRAREKFPGTHPRVITDNGPQFIARDFKEFIRVCEMTHVRTSPYYPQSNGKKERWYGSLKRECLRPKTPLSLEDARRVVSEYVRHYNEDRLHSALGYIAPAAKLEGLAESIFTARAEKLKLAREERQLQQKVEGSQQSLRL